MSPQTALSSQPQTEAPGAVHKSEKRLRSLVEAVPDLIFRLNPDGLYVDWKAGTDGELLVPPELFLGRHFREILPEPVSDRVAATIENARRSKKVETLEYELTLPRSGRQIYEARISVTDDGDALAVCRNVTERQRLIAAVESSEQRFRALVEHSFEGCTILDAAGVVRYDSPGSSRLLGFANDEMLGLNALERIHPDDLERCRAVLAALLQSPHQALTTQFRYQHKDGSWRWVESTARNLLDHPAVRGIVANWHDITERVQASEAMRRNEERLSALVENGHSGINVLDLQGRMLYSAPSNRRILGHAPDEVLGKSCFDFVHPDDLTAVRRGLEQTIRSSERVAFPRFRVRDLAGEWHWIEAAGQNLSAHPSVGGVVINWHDITAHVRAEVEQRRTAALFQAVADGTPDAVFVKDRAGRYLLLNQAAARFAGKDMSQMLGQNATMLFDADSARRIGELDRRVMERNRPETQDEQLTVGDVTRTFQTTKAPYRDEHGNVIGVVGISREITEWIAMEQALRDREERYRSLFESSSDAIFVNKGGRIILVNPVLVQMLGYDSAQQIIGKTPYDIIHSDYHDMVRERIRVLFEERQAVPFVEQKFVRRDGSTVEIEIAAAPFEDQGEIAIHVTARDITARKKAEAALRESEERFRQIAEHIQEVFWMADAEFTEAIYISPGYERVWGRTAESLYGDPKSFLDALHPEDRTRTIAALAAHRNRGGYCEEYRIIRPGGELRWIRDRAFPVRNEAGEVYRVVGLAEDITERHQAEEKLAQQHVELLHVSRLSTMGQMVAAMSHELSQPLTAACNFAAALAAQLAAPTEPDRALLRKHNDAIVQQCARAAAILQRLRDFGRKAPAHRGACDLNKVLHDSAALVQNELARTNVRLQFDLTAGLPEVEGDGIQLQQVIVNLLLNARDAMQTTPPADRIVVVRSQVAAAVAVIDFEDRGTGISADVALHLFQPFFSTKPTGMGIGLSICHTILEEHGGKIEALPNPHGGATFRCTLPVLKQPSDGSRAHRSRRG